METNGLSLLFTFALPYPLLLYPIISKISVWFLPDTTNSVSLTSE